MSEDTVLDEVEDQDQDQDTDIEQNQPVHPYDMPGEWFVLNAQSGHEKKSSNKYINQN